MEQDLRHYLESTEKERKGSQHYTQTGRGIWSLRTDSHTSLGPELLFLFVSALCDPRKEIPWGLDLQPETQILGCDLQIGSLADVLRPTHSKENCGGGSELQCPYLKCIDNIKHFKPV